MKVRIKPPSIYAEDNGIKPISPSLGEIVGPSHKNGGVDVTYGNKTVEAQGSEPVSVLGDGSLVFFGKLKDPANKKTFERQAKEIAEQERKDMKMSDKGNDLISANNPYITYESLKFNSGLVLADAANQRLMQDKQDIQSLANRQQIELWKKDNKDGKKAQSGLNLSWTQGPQIPAYQPVPQFSTLPEVVIQPNTPTQGGNITDNPLAEQARQAAIKYGVSPELYEKQLFLESSYNPKAVSGAGARGVAQLMKGTAKDLGLTEEEWRSTKPEDVSKQIEAGAKYMAQLKKKYNGDETLAVAAYNGGMGNIDKNLSRLAAIKKVNKKDLTGKDWYEFMTTRKDLPAGQKQTVDYYRNLVETPTEDFYKNRGQADMFRQQYYETPSPQPRRRDVVTPIEPITQLQPLSATPPPVGTEITRDAFQRATTPSAPQQPRRNSPRNTLTPLDYLPEIAAIFDRPDYVQGQQYNPQLLQPINISLQDQINQNTASFNALSRNMANNPEALATLAAQRYQQNQGVLGQEFRFNQQMANQIANQNNQILNQAQMTNIQLADQQMVRQDQARANTEAARNAALTSISNKYAMNRATNNALDQVDQRTRLMENFFNYRLDDQGNYNYQGPEAQWVISTQSQRLTPEQELELAKAEKLREQAEAIRLKTAQSQVKYKFGGKLKHLKSK